MGAAARVAELKAQLVDAKKLDNPAGRLPLAAQLTQEQESKTRKTNKDNMFVFVIKRERKNERTS